MTRFMQEHLLRGKLDRAPMVQPKARVDDLPAVDAPDIRNLTVEVPVPAPLSEGLLQAAAADLVRAHGEVTEKDPATPIGPEDDVLVDLVAYANGRVVPGSAKPQVWLTPEDEAALPGLRAVLNGQTIGKSVWFKVKYASDSPLADLADQQLVYAIDILAAQSVVPIELDAPALLEAAGVEQVDDLLAMLAEGLEAEREQTALHHAQLAIADALSAKLEQVEISAAILDAELAHRWNESEGAMLRDKGLSVDDQTYARDAFVQGAARRAELEHGLRTTLALAALAQAHSIKLDASDLDGWLEQMAAMEGRPVEDVREALKADTEAHGRVGQALLLEKTFGWVCEQVDVKWTQPPAD
ncbi:MAG: hypothetical protein AAF449_01995 [Myxococcota bacterium]